MRHPVFPACIALSFLLTACGQADDPQERSVGELGIPSGTYAVDKSHTYVVFSYLHQDLSYPLLRMTDIDGQLELDSTSMENSKASIAMAVDSIRTNLDYFDKELASRKFFHAEEYPYVTFATHSYKPLNDSLGELTGFVTIRDVTRPLVLAVSLNGAMEHPALKIPVIGFSATGSLKRSDFDLDRFIPAIADQVDVRIEAEFLQGSNPGSAAAAQLAAETVANADPASLDIVADSGAAK
jgi:polyisoprenoid-binding protein YceI